MGTPLHVVWDDELIRYDFGPDHPLNPVRLDLTIRLARALGVLDRAEVQMVSPPAASDGLLTTVHTPDYIEAVRKASAGPGTYDFAYGLGTPDNPTFPGMHEASARVVGGSVDAASAVWEGRAEHGVNIAGGLHHAMASSASGFCIYNDPAIAIRQLLDAGAEKVAYVDVDVHHGDGVEAAFYGDPRVLTISLHESPQTLFPGTGFPDQTGAEGTAVNVPLPPGTGDSGWLRAFHAVVPPLLREWRPQILVTQHGCDSHIDDPLAHLGLTVDAQRASYVTLHELAHELCGGRWVATGGGGYMLYEVVPRAWTHLLAEAAHDPVPPETETPEPWRDHVQIRLRRQAPLRMTDGGTTEFREWGAGYDPADSLDRAVMATRKAVFPLHGLDPNW